jgi:RNase P/RNase MRP subunit p29
MTQDLIVMVTKDQTLVEVPLSDGRLVKVPRDFAIAPANSVQYWNAAKQIMQSQGQQAAGLYGAVVAQAARALGYNNVDATNYHIRKWRKPTQTAWFGALV